MDGGAERLHANVIGVQAITIAVPSPPPCVDISRLQVEDPQPLVSEHRGASRVEQSDIEPSQIKTVGLVHMPEQYGAAPDFRADVEKRVGVLQSMVCRVGASVGETRCVVRQHEHEPLPHPGIFEKLSKCVELLLRKPSARPPRKSMGYGAVDRDSDCLCPQPPHEGPRIVDSRFRRIALQQIPEVTLEPSLLDDRVRVDIVVSGR